MSVFRAFIAVELSRDIIERLEQVSMDLREAGRELPLRWVSVRNIHLTLKFLGNVSLNNVEVLSEIIQACAASHNSFEISIGGGGAFPNNRTPRVIWVGVEAPQDLFSLYHSIDSETNHLGYKSDSREFSPHLTLARVARNATSAEIRAISTLLKTKKIGFLGAVLVNEIHLFRSDLKPGGAVYTRVFSASLRDVPAQAITKR